MADPVAIIAVAGSSAVGLGGILAAISGATAQRRWQSREERVTELRAVLDAAGEHMAAATQAISEANQAIRAATLDPGRAQEAKDSAREWFGDAMAAEKKLWSTVNRVQVRTGANSAVSEALKAAEREIGLLGAVVTHKLASGDMPGYDEAWAKAAAAEDAFYDAAANALEAAGKRS